MIEGALKVACHAESDSGAPGVRLIVVQAVAGSNPAATGALNPPDRG